ncbi:hypothetical protein AB0L71_28220 [Streptomyces sp. NPDC052052]|uniref:hypothetical protein n=1 Tax=Streptomyces sp. NPDC052052 TaxID=3154756 RepID=UPI00341C4C7B
MTDRLLHLVDRARRGVALDAELDQLAAGITEQAARITTLEHVAAGNKRHVQLIVPELDQLTTRAEKAERAVDHLTDRHRGAEARIDELEQQLAEADAETTEVLEHNDATCEAVAARDQAEAAIERVRELHPRWDADPASCAHCHDSYGTPLRYPCPTITILDGQQSVTGEFDGS